MALNPAFEPILLLGQDTPARVFRLRAREWATSSALRWKRLGLWQDVSWARYYEHARAVGLALEAQGLARGDVVCVLAENRPEWLYVDLGAQCMGMIGCGIYPTASVEQACHILQHSGARMLFVENQEQLDKALAARVECPLLQSIVVMERKGLRSLRDPGVQFFDDFLAQGLALAAEPDRTAAFDRAIDAATADDIAFLVYTSGTTGAPKGAMISNRNVVFQMVQAPSYLDLAPGGRSVSFLPLCHIAERMASVFNPIAVGLLVHFPENAGTVFNDLREVVPQVLFAPPRFWEKMQSQVDLFMRDASGPARWVYQQAQLRGRDAVDAQLQGEPGATVVRDGASTRLLRWAAFRNVRISLGLQQLQVALTGAATVPAGLIRWYMGCDIQLRESFGMTETSGFCTATPRGRIKLGWAGLPAVGTRIRLGTENEIQIRGPHIFAGYWKDPDKSREAIDDDGWLRTGDCGEIDADGYLAIRDRIKDILITSGGKNIAPTQIESRIRLSPYVTDAVVIGDARRYLTCLLMLDHEHVMRHAQEQQIPYTDFASLARAPGVNQLMRGEIERVNAELARVEQIKDFRIIGELLTAEDEELTPTMKLKRRVISRKYAQLIDDMYPD